MSSNHPAPPPDAPLGGTAQPGSLDHVEVLEMIATGHFGHQQNLPSRLREWPQVRPAMEVAAREIRSIRAALWAIHDGAYADNGLAGDIARQALRDNGLLGITQSQADEQRRGARGEEKMGTGKARTTRKPSNP